MGTNAAFVAHFKITFSPPTSASQKVKRQERLGDMRKIAREIYAAVDAVDAIQLAIPGGGQPATAGAFSGYEMGGAIKPQMGNFPAQVMLVGFYDVGSDSEAPPYSDRNVIVANEAVTGYGGQNLCVANPTTVIDTEVKALRTAINSAFVSYGLSDAFEVTWHRLEYKGVLFGDRGLHFPR